MTKVVYEVVVISKHFILHFANNNIFLKAVKNNTFVTLLWDHVIDFTDFGVADTPRGRGGIIVKNNTFVTSEAGSL